LAAVGDMNCHSSAVATAGGICSTVYPGFPNGRGTIQGGHITIDVTKMI
jgi:hypothetical protein